MKYSSILLYLLVLASCSTSEVEPDNEPNLRALSTEELSLADANNQFAVSLFQELEKDNQPNLFFSPLSVGMALGMTLNGAAGETRNGITDAIQFDGLDSAQINDGYSDLTDLLTSMDRKVDLGIANSVWYRNTLTVNAPFKSVIEKSYSGTVQGLDFNNSGSKDVINGWIEDNTNQKIKNMIQSIDPDMVMFLVNAIYFKGDWTYEFDKSKTKSATFYKENGSTTQVQMMYSKGAKLSAYSNSQVSLVDIPYGNGQFRFTILLPAVNTKTSDLLNSLNIESLNIWIAEADTLTAELEMPKFKMEWNKKINSELSNLGMEKAFSDGAELPYLFKERLGLKVGFVQHKSFLEVNEEGSEAAAVTVVGVVVTCACGGQFNKIRIDRPFIFFIREKHSRAILFAGQLSDPDLL